MSERREAECASRLEVLRFAVSVGTDDSEAGRFKIFDSSESLRSHLKSITAAGGIVVRGSIPQCGTKLATILADGTTCRDWPQ